MARITSWFSWNCGDDVKTVYLTGANENIFTPVQKLWTGSDPLILFINPTPSDTKLNENGKYLLKIGWNVDIDMGCGSLIYKLHYINPYPASTESE